MDEQQALKLEVGTKAASVLTPKPVKVVGVRVDPKMNKESGKEVGKLVVLICKHPDKEEPIEITKIKSLIADKAKVSGLWLNLDEDDKIQKGSPVATLLTTAASNTMEALVDKEVPTTQESEAKSYLCVKAY